MSGPVPAPRGPPQRCLNHSQDWADQMEDLGSPRSFNCSEGAQTPMKKVKQVRRRKTSIIYLHIYMESIGFPGDRGKESTCQCRRLKKLGFHPSEGKIPWRRACQPLQDSCLENPLGRGAWRATVHGVTKSQTELKRLSTHAPLGSRKLVLMSPSTQQWGRRYREQTSEHSEGGRRWDDLRQCVCLFQSWKHTLPYAKRRASGNLL